VEDYLYSPACLSSRLFPVPELKIDIKRASVWFSGGHTGENNEAANHIWNAGINGNMMEIIVFM